MGSAFVSSPSRSTATFYASNYVGSRSNAIGDSFDGLTSTSFGFRIYVFGGYDVSTSAFTWSTEPITGSCS